MGFASRRNSLRYPGYDYASPGGVFVTIVTHNRQHLFGEIRDAEPALTPAGLAVERRWHQVPDRFPGVMIDAFMVMPDHIHGILVIGARDADEMPTAGEIVRWFKAMVLSDYSIGVRDNAWHPYNGRLWQRGFHDHIIRGERDLMLIRQYIDANPARWCDNQT